MTILQCQNVKIDSLQPPYSAASCSQFIWEKLNIAALWLQPAVMDFDVSPYKEDCDSLNSINIGPISGLKRFI